MSKTENAKKMIGLCKKSLADNEHNIRKVKGVPMTQSDVETAILYGETIIRCGDYHSELMTPRGEVAELLEKFALLA